MWLATDFAKKLSIGEANSSHLSATDSIWLPTLVLFMCFFKWGKTASRLIIWWFEKHMKWTSTANQISTGWWFDVQHLFMKTIHCSKSSSLTDGQHVGHVSYVWCHLYRPSKCIESAFLSIFLLFLVPLSIDMGWFVVNDRHLPRKHDFSFSVSSTKSICLVLVN